MVLGSAPRLPSVTTFVLLDTAGSLSRAPQLPFLLAALVALLLLHLNSEAVSVALVAPRAAGMELARLWTPAEPAQS